MGSDRQQVNGGVLPARKRRHPPYPVDLPRTKRSSPPPHLSGPFLQNHRSAQRRSKTGREIFQHEQTLDSGTDPRTEGGKCEAGGHPLQDSGRREKWRQGTRKESSEGQQRERNGKAWAVEGGKGADLAEKVEKGSRSVLMGAGR